MAKSKTKYYVMGGLAALLVVLAILFATKVIPLPAQSVLQDNSPLGQCASHLNGCGTTADCTKVLAAQNLTPDTINNVLSQCAKVGYKVSP